MSRINHKDGTRDLRVLDNAGLDVVAGGADKNSDYTNYMQLMSNVLRMLEDTNKAIIGNIR